MTSAFDGILPRYVLASSHFGTKLARVRPGQWARPTPCTDWNVRQLVNHMTQGNLNYRRLLDGASSAEFLRLRDADALGEDPAGAYARSVAECTAAFARPGALQQVLDYPLGRVSGQQALAVRTTDTAIHTWDLARAIGTDDTLSPALVGWISDHLDEIYRGLAESPTASQTTHRFFAAPSAEPAAGAAQQHLLLHRMGRRPWPAA
ncbi:MAG TPA: TIGR03086 family metal-binding protein [Streptosporangiaceae bacterium]